ncbi:tripartite tricarboxylate transporter substrate binding protein [Bradyrhizobium sp. 180]|uniref:Bug family tripartite tricarboxylate transporter substrate binding protein n=2 Tax=Bradyrhizobium TaxID=374 RepID=UPI001FFB8FD5|nr:MULTISPECIES: tripartite tricarboxylate transporter substrate binding protein [unclassified Bradyrhizobium]MCK1422825.1 tripartite tricarboxylate transporter substrate binding protein [Bradyrhizobium sp. CW12]MCK1492238.1 tripartite tricarboxylate transporter substrate binding protein [Bradyrhizobium sp. 180]MCK1532569.1 tripartite tricarboxylate transporter substrate binding protein [Bradyrhizobium sp. 182]MCK1598949.1 tripartite tricarboxylate transporter substrate binding protein [Bradyrh
MQRTLRLLAIVAGLCVTTQALAQKYPARPVKIMVGFSAGGPVDVVARIIGDRLSNKLGQPFVVENRAGANGMIAAEGVARADADGYTILACNSSTITLNKTLFRDIRYDPEKDFAPLTTVVSAPLVLVVNPENPKTANIKSVADLVAAAKAAPGALAYGSGGNGNLAHLAMELLSQKAGIKMIHVPYRGGSASEVGLLAQEVLAVFDPLSAVPLVKAGKLRALAVSSAERLPSLPDVPTVAEAGYPGFDISFWVGFFMPKATPAPILETLHREIITAAKDPSVEDKLGSQGVVSVLSPTEYAAKIAKETKELADVVAAASIKAE